MQREVRPAVQRLAAVAPQLQRLHVACDLDPFCPNYNLLLQCTHLQELRIQHVTYSRQQERRILLAFITAQLSEDAPLPPPEPPHNLPLPRLMWRQTLRAIDWDIVWNDEALMWVSTPGMLPALRSVRIGANFSAGFSDGTSNQVSSW
jgi:hypothetical protein